jgi:2-polyprenyl-6-methoxyphenol hydroxylase-like FAD-dependent oxidoreductase
MNERLDAECCIAGGGPAGMMLGYLLARAGVRTVVLEKHADFLRDFRGDTVHPSTLRVLDELGLLETFLERPHQKLRRVSLVVGDERVTMADFSGLPERYAFIAFMPQWEFLDFLADAAEALPAFTLRRRHVATGLVREGDRVVGVRAESPEGGVVVRAGCNVAADGRHSALRAAAGLPATTIGAPIDVLWFRVRREAGTTDDALGRLAPGRMAVTIDRGDYWQVAYVIAKGGADGLRARGLDAFKADAIAVAPVLARHIDRDVASWDDVKLLSVAIDRLERWSLPGLLCIGDAAHAMSPVGGVGINLAIQDAVAAADRLVEPLRRGTPSERDLEAVQARRLFPTRVTQALQVQVQDLLVMPTLGARDAIEVPLPARIVSRVPALQRLLARGIGMGVRAEHVRNPRILAGPS